MTIFRFYFIFFSNVFFFFGVYFCKRQMVLALPMVAVITLPSSEIWIRLFCGLADNEMREWDAPSNGTVEGVLVCKLLYFRNWPGLKNVGTRIFQLDWYNILHLPSGHFSLLLSGVSQGGFTERQSCRWCSRLKKKQLSFSIRLEQSTYFLCFFIAL